MNTKVIAPKNGLELGKTERYERKDASKNDCIWKVKSVKSDSIDLIYILKFDGGYQREQIKGYFSTLKKAKEARKKELAECYQGGTPEDWEIEINKLV